VFVKKAGHISTAPPGYANMSYESDTCY